MGSSEDVDAARGDPVGLASEIDQNQKQKHLLLNVLFLMKLTSSWIFKHQKP